jgi:hypothetical protein
VLWPYINPPSRGGARPALRRTAAAPRTLPPHRRVLGLTARLPPPPPLLSLLALPFPSHPVPVCVGSTRAGAFSAGPSCWAAPSALRGEEVCDVPLAGPRTRLLLLLLLPCCCCWVNGGGCGLLAAAWPPLHPAPVAAWLHGGSTCQHNFHGGERGQGDHVPDRLLTARGRAAAGQARGAAAGACNRSPLLLGPAGAIRSVPAPPVRPGIPKSDVGVGRKAGRRRPTCPRGKHRAPPPSGTCWSAVRPCLPRPPTCACG